MAKNFEFDVSDTRNLTNALTKKLHTFIEREREREREQVNTLDQVQIENKEWK